MSDHLEQAVAVFPREPESAWRAREWIWHTTACQVNCETQSTIESIVGELVANAIVHGSGPITLEAIRFAGHVRVCVGDRGAGDVHLRRPGPLSLDGYGLVLVEALAQEWGVESLGDGRGKRVWAEVGLDTPDQGLAPGYARPLHLA